MAGKTLSSVSFFKVGLHIHNVPQNKDEFIINNLFYCYKALTFTQPLVHEFSVRPILNLSSCNDTGGA